MTIGGALSAAGKSGMPTATNRNTAVGQAGPSQPSSKNYWVLKKNLDINKNRMN
jgi:hypothetical protein